MSDDEAPSVPPKLNLSNEDSSRANGMRPPQLGLPSFGSLDPGLVVPLTPTSPTSNPSSPSADGKPRKSNPLLDLIDTEKNYVERLTGIIRKVAAAWSRSNLPPPELDRMFRSIECVYKANRSLLSKLKEIGPNPGSPKLLGDLLMRWIDDLETPYTTYCAKYSAGFDSWQPVQSNARLPDVLATFSAASPPPPSYSSPEPPLWTLDALFLLPRDRLKYYKKLYSRLLKSTTPGRSDHRLLVGALDKLDGLLATLEQRQQVNVGSSMAPLPPPTPVETEDEVVIDMRTRSMSSNVASHERGQDRFSGPDTALGSEISSAGESQSSRERFSAETGSTSISRGSSQTMSMPISDLERRLSTERTLDIFTMKLRSVRLQMAPTNLTYTRELRFSVDAVISVIPRATGQEVVHPKGHLFLMSDLFLICEKMTPEERALGGPDGPDMWLCYPPLAGKVLRVAEIEGRDNAFDVIIMRKETLTIQVESRQARDFMLEQFRECIDFAMSLPPPNSQPPPPVPTIPGSIPRSGSAPPNAVRPPRASPFAPITAQRTGGSSGVTSPPRTSSPEGSVSQLPSPESRFSPPRPPDKEPLPSIDSRYSQGQNDPRFSQGQNDPRYSQGMGSDPRYSQGRSNDGRSSQGPSPPPRGPLGMSPPPRQGTLGISPAAQIQQQQHAQWNAQNAQQQQFLNNDLPAIPGGPGGGFVPGQVMPGRSQTFTPSSGADPRGPPIRSASFTGEPQDPRGFGYSQNPNASFQGPPPQRPGSGPGAGPGPGGYGRGPGFDGPPGSEQSLRNAASSRSLGNQYQHGQPPYGPGPGGPPPMPYQQQQQQNGGYGGPPQGYGGPGGPPHQPQPRSMPSTVVGSVGNSRASSMHSGYDDEPSPPPSPVEELVHTGPVTNVISAQMKCKVFLKREHAQWKSLGSAKLKLYRQEPTNIKQLVVEADDKNKTVLISTIVLSDGVERVGKTGVAIELSDRGARTGIVYMIQLKNEASTIGLYDTMLAGSDRYLTK